MANSAHWTTSKRKKVVQEEPKRGRESLMHFIPQKFSQCWPPTFWVWKMFCYNCLAFHAFYFSFILIWFSFWSLSSNSSLILSEFRNTFYSFLPFHNEMSRIDLIGPSTYHPNKWINEWMNTIYISSNEWSFDFEMRSHITDLTFIKSNISNTISLYY